MPLDAFDEKSAEWFEKEVSELTTELRLLKPSEWAEEVRYLPPQVTPIPGNYSFDICPFLREIVDNFDPLSPVREIDVLKGVQVGFTVGVLENVIGYVMDYVKSAPMMFLTADAELAKLRMDTYVNPMIEHSNLTHLITSHDQTNSRKTGKTDKKIEWEGGGFLIPFGAQNANKLRSISIQYLLEDEIDSYPIRVGRDGDPLKLAEDRTAAFEATRKIGRGSTPLILQDSKAWREYKKGDQRKYNVPCRGCGKKQELVWHGVNEDGTIYGIVWERDEDGILVAGSVRYVCKFCAHEHTNDDKTWMYRQKGKHCEWVPTAKPEHPFRRSYHLSALYSPVGMQTWETQVRKFLECYDPDQQKIIDLDLYQQFRNNVQGLPFELRGEKITYEKVLNHRRPHYKSKMVPNILATEETGGRVLVLTAAVDVHKTHLDVLVQGHTRGNRQYSVDWFKIEGDCSSIDGEPWEKLRDFIDTTEYESDDGHTYKPLLTLVDTQYLTNVAQDFTNQYETGVLAIQGRDKTRSAAGQNRFGEYKTKTGVPAMYITVDIYKDALASGLNREWTGMGQQPMGYLNYPHDYPDQFFKELTMEQKVQKIDARTGKKLGFIWKRPGNADNHAWDLSVYCTAALEMVALGICEEQFGIDYVNWNAFWDHISTGRFTVQGKFNE